MAMDLLKGFEKPKLDGDNQSEPKLDPLGQRAAALPVSPKHSCTKSHFCKLSWGLLGCIKLYKLTSAKERHRYCRLSNCCNRCGAAICPNLPVPPQGCGSINAVGEMAR